MAKDLHNNFLEGLLKETNNEYGSLMDEETLSTVTEYIDTGSYALNGLLTADIYKGLPNNKTIALAGDEATGKTFLCLDICKHAIDNGYLIVYFDSENAVDPQMLKSRGIDVNKVLYMPVETVEGFRDQMVKIVNKYNDTDEKKRPKLLCVLDSLGNLSTTKEISDIEEGSGKADMTRARGVKSIFRVLNLKLAKAKIPLIITNHTYTTMSAFIASKKMGGGSGIYYAASMIIFLSKSKDKDKDKNVIGNIIYAKNVKNRFAKQDKVVKLNLNFNTGLNKYYGLELFGEPSIKKVRGGWEINGKEVSEDELFKMEWPKETLDAINSKIIKSFSYGQIIESVDVPELEMPDEEESK